MPEDCDEVTPALAWALAEADAFALGDVAAAALVKDTVPDFAAGQVTFVAEYCAGAFALAAGRPTTGVTPETLFASVGVGSATDFAIAT